MMENEKKIVIFYTLYFGWLFTLTTLTVDVKLQNYFALVVVIFYFLFLRDYWDPLIFTLSAISIVAYNTVNIAGGSFVVDPQTLTDTPVWLPLAWGTTAVALKKFYKIVTRKINLA